MDGGAAADQSELQQTGTCLPTSLSYTEYLSLNENWAAVDLCCLVKY